MAKDPVSWRARPGGGVVIASVHIGDGMPQSGAGTRARREASSALRLTDGGVGMPCRS